MSKHIKYLFSIILVVLTSLVVVSFIANKIYEKIMIKKFVDVSNDYFNR